MTKISKEAVNTKQSKRGSKRLTKSEFWVFLVGLIAATITTVFHPTLITVPGCTLCYAFVITFILWGYKYRKLNDQDK